MFNLGKRKEKEIYIYIYICQNKNLRLEIGNAIAQNKFYTPTLNFNCTLLRKRIRTYFQFYGMNSEAQSQVQVTG